MQYECAKCLRVNAGKINMLTLCREINMRITIDVTFGHRFRDLGPSNWTFWLNQVLEEVSKEVESSLDFSSSVCS